MAKVIVVALNDQVIKEKDKAGNPTGKETPFQVVRLFEQDHDTTYEYWLKPGTIPESMVSDLFAKGGIKICNAEFGRNNNGKVKLLSLEQE